MLLGSLRFEKANKIDHFGKQRLGEPLDLSEEEVLRAHWMVASTIGLGVSVRSIVRGGDLGQR